uniref:Uncharacterized protein n=1 Tax=Glossina palpalis gambiensis TaxID=67801 RepID=A0A1B0AQE4_9MUSC
MVPAESTPHGNRYVFKVLSVVEVCWRVKSPPPPPLVIPPPLPEALADDCGTTTAVEPVAVCEALVLRLAAVFVSIYYGVEFAYEQWQLVFNCLLQRFKIKSSFS